MELKTEFTTYNILRIDTVFYNIVENIDHKIKEIKKDNSTESEIKQNL